MAKAISLYGGVGSLLTTDLQTVMYNRGTNPVNIPFESPPIPTLTSRALPGNHLESIGGSAATRMGNSLNAIHDNDAFLNVAGVRWRQWRPLADTDSYTIVPLTDCESGFVITVAGQAEITLDLTDANILPGMKFRFARPADASIGNLIISLVNGNALNPATAVTGNTWTITRWGFLDLMMLGNAVPSGPKALVLNMSNTTSI